MRILSFFSRSTVLRAQEQCLWLWQGIKVCFCNTDFSQTQKDYLPENQTSTGAQSAPITSTEKAREPQHTGKRKKQAPTSCLTRHPPFQSTVKPKPVWTSGPNGLTFRTENRSNEHVSRISEPAQRKRSATKKRNLQRQNSNHFLFM